MRIKTSSFVDMHLDELKDALNFSTKAEVLLLAMNLAINEGDYDSSLEVDEKGFEVDTRIIFDDDAEYYKYLIKQYTKVDYVTKKEYNILIEVGINILLGEVKKSRNKNINLLENLLRR